MEEDSQGWLRGTATVGSKERGERLSRISVSSAQRTPFETMLPRHVWGHINSQQEGVSDGFEILSKTLTNDKYPWFFLLKGPIKFQILPNIIF